MLQILEEIRSKTDDQKADLLKPLTFGPWIQANYGIKSSQSARILNILGSEFWTRLWSGYVKTSYGQKFFNFSVADDIVNSGNERSGILLLSGKLYLGITTLTAPRVIGKF